MRNVAWCDLEVLFVRLLAFKTTEMNLEPLVFDNHLLQRALYFQFLAFLDITSLDHLS